MEFHQTLQTHSYLQDNTYNKKTLELGANNIKFLPFVILNGFCIDSFLNTMYLKEALIEFHQNLQTHSHLQDKYMYL